MSSTDPGTEQPRVTNVFLGVIALILTLAALKAAQWVVLPVLMSFFLAILLKPVLEWLDRFIPYGASLLVVFVGFVGLVAVTGLFLSSSASAVIDKGPEYAERFRQITADVASQLSSVGIDVTLSDVSDEQAMKYVVQFLGASLTSFLQVLTMTTLVAFMFVLLLLETPYFHKRLEKASFGSSWSGFVQPATEVIEKFQTYFFTKTVISAATGTLTALVTWLIGLDFPVVWGVLAFLLNYIPNIGSIIAVVPPTLIAVVQYGSVSYGLVTLFGLGSIQMFIGNFLDPRIMGRSLSLSPFVVFVSMVFWGWMWGVIGVFLAVPLTVGLSIVFSYVPALKPLSRLMQGGRQGPAHATTDSAVAEESSVVGESADAPA